MLSLLLYASLGGFILGDFLVDAEAKIATLFLKAEAAKTPCPLCQLESNKIQSCYTRTLADLPFAEFSLVLKLYTRRFWCNNGECQRKIFAEGFHDLAARKARRTLRLNTRLSEFGFAQGGEPGARLATKGGMPVSGDTLLRLVRSMAPGESEVPQLLGVDDFALKKGHNYATILVDLATHQPIELLEDRTADTFATWLENHPGVEIISRDRASAYAEAGHRSAPQALQIADKFHILQNLTQTLKELFTLQNHWLKLVDPTAPLSEVSTAPEVIDVHSEATFSQIELPSPVLLLDATGKEQPDLLTENDPSPKGKRYNAHFNKAVQLEQNRRVRRFERYTKVMELHKQGESMARISFKLGIDQRTVKKFVVAEGYPELTPHKARGFSILKPFENYLQESWNKGQRTVKVLLGELKEQGYRGGSTIVYGFVRRELKKLAENELQEKIRGTGIRKAGRANLEEITPRKGAWLLICKSEKLKETQQDELKKLISIHPEVASIYQLVQDFREMLMEHKIENWGSWLERAKATGLASLQSFVGGLERDADAVKAAIISEISNGQVEGQVNRLKLIKRQMFGRARLDLLRARVLART